MSTHVFDRQRYPLDSGLASSALKSQVTGTESWTINADESLFIDYSTQFYGPRLFEANPFRSSDHDLAVVVGINLDMTPAPTLNSTVHRDRRSWNRCDDGCCYRFFSDTCQFRQRLDDADDRLVLSAPASKAERGGFRN